VDRKQYEILALTFRYWFVLLIMIIFVQCTIRTIRDVFTNRKVMRSSGNIPFLLVLFSLTAFGLLATQSSQGFDFDTAILGVLVSAVILFQFYVFYYLFHGMDEVIVLIVDTLAILGFVMLQRLTPELAIRQIEWFVIGNVFLFIIMLVLPKLRHPGRFVFPLMILGPLTLFIVALFGQESGGATSLLGIGPITIQPAEFVKLIFIIVMSYYLDEKKTFRERIPAFLFVMTSILGVVAQKDLGGALLYFLVFLFMYQISTSDWLITIFTAGAGVLAAVFSYRIFPHVQVRVEAWKNPWADIGGKGWQVAQALIAMGSGGLLGLGLGLGTPYVIPASRTDFIFAAICEEFGIIVGGMIIGFYVLIVLRSMKKAYEANEPADMLLASGSAISIGIQSFIIIGGVIKMIPLTGITLPFISYGGSSMVVSLSTLALIQSVSIKNQRFAKKMGIDDEYEESELYYNEDENKDNYNVDEEV
jgi:cell division protein FtsW (lipid II flippase)